MTLITRFLHTKEVIEIHDLILDEAGGARGIRDLGLLQSAVAMPKSQYQNQYLHPTLFDQAAAYLFHICMNHSFIDGNKRTAAISALVFLEDNHCSPSIDELEYEELIVDTAKGLTSKQVLSAFFQNCTVETIL